jgi:hypothetical protein
MGKKSGSGFGMNNPDHISDSLETGIQNLKKLDPRWKKFGSRVEKSSSWIREKNSNP